MEERKESSQTSTLEKQSSKEDSTIEEKNSKPDDKKFVENSSPTKIEEKPTLIDNDESTVRYIQVNCNESGLPHKQTLCDFVEI